MNHSINLVKIGELNKQQAWQPSPLDKEAPVPAVVEQTEIAELFIVELGVRPGPERFALVLCAVWTVGMNLKYSKNEQRQ